MADAYGRSDQTIVLQIRDLTRLPRCPAPHQLLRPRDGEAVRISYQPFRPSRLTLPQLYKCRWQVEVFFKWIKHHLQIKAFFRYLRERGQDADLDRYQHVRARGHRQEAAGGGPPSGRYETCVAWGFARGGAQVVRVHRRQHVAM